MLERISLGYHCLYFKTAGTACLAAFFDETFELSSTDARAWGNCCNLSSGLEMPAAYYFLIRG